MNNTVHQAMSLCACATHKTVEGLSCLEIIGLVSSIATIVLFIIYFIGRTITFFMEKNMFYDEFAYENIKQGFKKQYQIVDNISLDSCDPDEDSYNCIILTSRKGMRKIRVYRLEYSDKDKELTPYPKECVGQCDFLNIGESLAIYARIGEIYPTYRIIYETFDFKKATFDTVDKNMINGVESTLIISKHTWKSVIYYFFR